MNCVVIYGPQTISMRKAFKAEKFSVENDIRPGSLKSLLPRLTSLL